MDALDLDYEELINYDCTYEYPLFHEPGPSRMDPIALASSIDYHAQMIDAMPEDQVHVILPALHPEAQL